MPVANQPLMSATMSVGVEAWMQMVPVGETGAMTALETVASGVVQLTLAVRLGVPQG